MQNVPASYDLGRDLGSYRNRITPPGIPIDNSTWNNRPRSYQHVNTEMATRRVPLTNLLAYMVHHCTYAIYRLPDRYAPTTTTGGMAIHLPATTLLEVAVIRPRTPPIPEFSSSTHKSSAENTTTTHNA